MYNIFVCTTEDRGFAVSYRNPATNKHWKKLPNGNWIDTRNPEKEFMQIMEVETHNKAKHVKEALSMYYRDNDYKKILIKDNW